MMVPHGTAPLRFSRNLGNYQHTAAPAPVPSGDSLKYSRILDRLVAQDSRSCAVNQYDQGSMTNASVKQSTNGKATRVKGFYTYNGGKSGWVEAELINGRLSCLHYWDRTDCSQLGQGLGTQLEAAAAEAERNQRLHPTRATPSESHEPSALECHMYKSAPMIAGMAGYPPWSW